MSDAATGDRRAWVASQHARHYAHLMTFLPAMVGAMGWSREAIDAHQQAELRATIAHAKAHSPWHAARLAHIDAATMTRADLARVPAMTKADLMANWDDIVTVPGATLAGAEAFLETLKADDYWLETNHVCSSGGSSGQTGVVVYDWEGFARHFAGVCRGHIPLIMRIAPPTSLRAASVGADSARHISFACAQAFATTGNPTVPAPTSLPRARIAAILNAKQPQFLHSYPSALKMLLAMADEGTLTIVPDIVVSTSEPLPDDLAQRIRARWPGCTLLNIWSATEGSGTFPCTGDAAFHVSEDLNIIEPAGPDGGVYLTNLYNRALPLIRFRLDDRFAFMDRPCSCGSAYQAVASVAGRTHGSFDWPGGVSVSTVLFESALIATPGVVNFQVTQTPRGVDVAIEMAGGEAGDLAPRLERALTNAGLAEPVVRVDAVEAIARTAGGKIRRYVAQ